jgi:hypothetical protein
MGISLVRRLILLVGVLALVVVTTVPPAISATPMPQMTGSTHCPGCPDKAPAEPGKAMPCGVVICLGEVAAVLPASGIPPKSRVHAIRYVLAVSSDLTGLSLLPESPPPKPSVQV